MKVFALKFLETMQSDEVIGVEGWSWSPKSETAIRVYASGNSTRSRESTYAAEKDTRQDEDRPNEGLAA